MEGALMLAAIPAAAACPAILWLAYRSLKAPFFLYLPVAGILLGCAAAASFLNVLEALSDLGLAASGIALAAAAYQLRIAFGLAGEGHD